MTIFYQCQIPDIPLERKKPSKACKDVFHGYMTKAIQLDPEFGMPIMRPELEVPRGVVSFSEAMDSKTTDFDQYVHFYEHDAKIERFWKSPWKYMDRLSNFAGFLSTDYSSTPDMPKPQRAYNVYRNQLVGSWLQDLGYNSICNVRCPAEGHDYSIAGAPRHSLLGVGAVGCIKNRECRRRFEGGIARIVDELEPAGLVVVGEDAYDVFDYAKAKGVPIYFYPGPTQKHFNKVHHER